jgi:hypothetical protein
MWVHGKVADAVKTDEEWKFECMDSMDGTLTASGSSEDECPSEDPATFSADAVLAGSGAWFDGITSGVPQCMYMTGSTDSAGSSCNSPSGSDTSWSERDSSNTVDLGARAAAGGTSPWDVDVRAAAGGPSPWDDVPSAFHGTFDGTVDPWTFANARAGGGSALQDSPPEAAAGAPIPWQYVDPADGMRLAAGSTRELTTEPTKRQRKIQPAVIPAVPVSSKSPGPSATAEKAQATADEFQPTRAGVGAANQIQIQIQNQNPPPGGLGLILKAPIVAAAEAAALHGPLSLVS